jgi:CRISPR/Cas system-associated endonuclease Cas3-HD
LADIFHEPGANGVIDDILRYLQQVVDYAHNSRVAIALPIVLADVLAAVVVRRAEEEVVAHIIVTALLLEEDLLAIIFYGGDG